MFLSLVFHNHQPVGQLPWAFENAWRDSYDPFLGVLEKHPRVRVALHYTGPLLDWLEEHRPETIARVRALVARGQVEVLAGGDAEPILAIWPREDQIAQLICLRDRVTNLFGVAPRGAWLAERVWENELPEPLREANIDFTFVDSTVFADAGIPESQQHGFFTSRSGDAAINIFPINQTLRHHIPWSAAEHSIGYLQELHDENADALALFADDGEKFGAWPGTFDFVFTKGWLDTFFQALEDNAEWLETITPAEYATRFAAKGEAKLQSGSYSEMQDWSSGNWRNFLDRYREARDMTDETLRVRRLVQNAPQDLRQRAMPHILRAQSNDPLWHGVFGGLYLRHLRQSIYRECALAQEIVEGDKTFVRASEENEAIIIENERLKLGARDGQLFLLSSKPARHNFLSTLRRRRETYHGDGAIVDWYARGALVDHFFGDATTPENFMVALFPEEGDFASEAWQSEGLSGASGALLRMQRDGNVWQQGTLCPLRIVKTVRLQASLGEIEVRYDFTNTGESPLALRWGNEWNLAMTGAQLPERHYHADDHKTKLSLEKPAQFAAVSNPIAADTWRKMWFEWNFPDSPAMWHVPIETVSQKEGGDIERTHQSSAFVFIRRLNIAPGETQSFDWNVSLTTK
ncbi:MAG TPA: alpha-amylase/4-alpha-glucanotransferase domain-containing protein [Abditibacteriaceae bacterium]|jgi:alpha-amylase